LLNRRKTEIKHDAIVQTIDNNSVTVVLLNNVRCSGCHAEKACGISGNESKTIVIWGRYNLKPGNKITVTMKLSDGYRALFLGYLLPLLIFLFCLVFLSSLLVNELLSGLIALGTLILYYLIFYLFNKSINAKFSFNIKT
jgi:sigma-E factor negative regulatory protein RseC